MSGFELVPDHRTPRCDHDTLNGCYHCCAACDGDLHQCVGCGEPMKHYGCSGSRLGTCNDCRKEYFR